MAVQKQTIANYNARIDQAERLGDANLKIALKDQIADEYRLKEELERINGFWAKQNLERDQNTDRWRDDGGRV